MSFPCRRIAVPACLLVCAAAAAQSRITFVAPIVLGELATAPPRLVPIVGMRMRILGASTTGGSPVISADTDAAGAIQLPVGFLPAQAVAAGPENADLHVKRQVDYPPGQHTEVTSSVNFPVVAGGTYDITAYPPPSGPLVAQLTAAQANAFYHLRAAHLVLGPMLPALPPGPLLVAFGPSNSSPSSYTLHDLLTGAERLNLGTGFADPDTSLAARSASAMAHEYGHRVFQNLYAARSATWLPRMDEGVADYLASVVTGSPFIGLGVIHSPRSVDNDARYGIDFQGEEHHDGLIVAGALYEARQLFQMHGIGPAFDSMFGTALAGTPLTETDLARELLRRDDLDGDLTNGTPHAELLYRAFTLRHAIPWPTGAAVPQPTGTVAPVVAGWSSGGGAPPDLRGSFAHGSTQFGLLASFGRPGQPGFVLGSPAPAAPVPVQPGLAAFLDFGQLSPFLWFTTDGSGRATMTLPLPPGLPPLAIEAACFDPSGPFGVALTNGLRAVP